MGQVYAVDLLGLVLALGAAPAPSAAPPPLEVVRPARTFTVVHEAPGSSAGVLIGPRTEYGKPIRYVVVKRRGTWLGVITPAVPNGRIGWVRTSSVRRTRYVREHVEIDLSRRLLRLKRSAGQRSTSKQRIACRRATASRWTVGRGPG